MYRTAVVRVYDVVGTVFINATVTEYPGTPGDCEPNQFVVSTSMLGTGEDNWRRWLYEGLRALATEGEPQ